MYPYLSRILSVEGFGLISFSMSFVVIFQTIVEFGFMISATAEISMNRSDKEKVSKIYSITMKAKLLLSIVSIVIFILMSNFISMISNNFLIIFLFLINAVTTALLPDFYFRGLEQMGTITIRTISVRLFSILLVFLIVKNDSHIIFVPIALLLGSIFALISSLLIIRKAEIIFSKELTPIKESVLSIKKTSLFFFSRIAVSINGTLGSFFLGLNYLPQSFEVGVFSGALRLSSACEMMSPPIIDTIYPHMINKKDYSFYRKIFIIGMIIWFIVILIVFSYSNLICSIILGSKYVTVGKYLKILLCGSLFSFPNTMCGYVALSPIGKSNHANISLIISTSVTGIACIILLFSQKINLLNICIVLSSYNFISFIYRSTILFKSRKLISSLTTNK
jgi:O-antigen/teichoic acid export membrane protein